MLVETKIACKLAGITPKRFNEIVSRGEYWCAPETVRGSKRMFERSDVLALSYFGALTSSDFDLQRAAYYACKLRELLAKNPNLKTFYIIKTICGPTTVTDEVIDRKKNKFMSGRTIYSVDEVDLVPFIEILNRDIKTFCIQ